MKNFLTITSSRAEYGILRIFLKKIKKSKKINNKLVVTGTHLSKKFGETINEIKRDNIEIYKKIEILTKTVNSHDISITFAKTIKKFSSFFNKKKPDAIILLGDRYEIFAIAITAFIHQIPIVHIHGGELSYGSLDDSFRHSISKLSNRHFVSTLIYKKRLIQLGEQPASIINIGSLGVEAINKTIFLKKKYLEKNLNVKFNNKLLIVSLHPVTNNKFENKKLINEVLKALFKQKETTLIFTYPNADEGNDVIINSIKKFIKKYPSSYFFKNLGHQKYFSLVKISDGILGNSSSAIIEIPSLKKPSINIGNRQDGRVRSATVVDCKADNILISKSIEKIYSKSFLNKIKKTKNKYYKKSSSDLLIKRIEKINFKKSNYKKFYDFNKSNISFLN